jgi:Ca2+-binding EF-hand superfamily protein
MELNKTWIAVAGGALVLVAGSVALFADWGGGKKARASTPSGATAAMRLLPFDADKDGRVTRTEVDAGITAQFSAADTDADGKLDAAEILNYNDKRQADRRAKYEAWKAKAAALGVDPGRPPSDRDAVDTLRAADWNLDGAITADEFGGKTRALAMRADRNGDGTIDAGEMKRRSVRRGQEAKPVEAAPAAAPANENTASQTEAETEQE